jgi:hypothetical protein
MGITSRTVQDPARSEEEIGRHHMRASIISDNKPSGLGAVPDAMRARFALGFTWFLACAYLGSRLLVWAAISHFRLVSISLPLIILLWVFLFFSGRWLLGRLADSLSSQFATGVVNKAPAPAATVPQLESGQEMTSWHVHLEPWNFPELPLQARIIDFQTSGISLTVPRRALARHSDPNLESILFENAAFANLLNASMLQPRELLAPPSAQMDAPTHATEAIVIKSRRFITMANGVYFGRHCLRIGHGITANVSVRVRPELATAVVSTPLTIGVPRHDLTPDFPRFVERVSFPQA